MNREQFQKEADYRLNKKLDYQDGVETLFDLRRTQAEAVRNLDEWNMLAMAAIASETDDGGKPVHSNPEKRGAALLIRQANSEEHPGLEGKIDECNLAIAKAMNSQARLAIALESVTAMIDYELNHPAEEINAQINQFSEHVQRSVDQAATAAVRRVLIEIGNA